MPRDDFPKPVIEVLAKRVGVRCSNPLCRKLTTGPRSEPGRIVNIGVAAHITAAAEGGPRFDATLSTEERQSPENGIWLCQNCAKLVDNDAGHYTVGLLKGWRQRAEQAARAEVEGRGGPKVEDGYAELELSVRTRHQGADRHDYDLLVIVRNLGIEALGPYQIDIEFPRAVIHQPHGYVLYVPDRGNNDIAFFRLISDRDRPNEAIYPGDSKIVAKIEYFMNDQLFYGHRGLFELPVRATLYQRGVRPVTVEGVFGDFQKY